jgi:hypothetical protein
MAADFAAKVGTAHSFLTESLTLLDQIIKNENVVVAKHDKTKVESYLQEMEAMIVFLKAKINKTK